MKLAIVGTGIINHLGESAHDILNSPDGHNTVQSVKNISIRSVESRTLRRTSQYAKLLIKSAELAFEDSEIDLEKVNKDRIGTVMNTAYGPLETNVKFAKSVLKGDPDLVSPTVFANTVTNAALGHLCIMFGLKGDSTFLMGSNPVKYSSFLLKKNHIDRILIGAVEEYSEDLAEEYHRFYKEYTTNVPAECAAALLVESAQGTSNEIAYIYDSYGFSLLSNPFIEPVKRESFREDLEELYHEVSKEHGNIDLVILGAANTQIEEAEREVLNHFGYQNQIDFKAKIGEVFGANLVASLVLATEILKQDQSINKIAVNHLDISMNYFTVIIGRD